MKIGLIGLGRMGYNLALNFRDHSIEVIAYNRSKEKVEKIMKEEGVKGAFTLEELVEQLDKPRILWMMIPAGKPVDDMIEQVVPLLEPGDILIDGGNSNYKDTLRRAQQLKEKGIHFVDVGTSGGVSGARHGACMMIGAPDDVFQLLEPIFKAVNVENGYLHCGPVGSGHFVKMVHNGIEYGMLQAIAEGFEILEASQFDFDLEQIARVWNHGSVIRGWLMELTQNAFRKDPKLESIRGVIDHSGEGLWTAQEALELGVPAPIITTSLMVRFRSQQDDSFAGKVVAALRNEFGGHPVTKKE